MYGAILLAVAIVIEVGATSLFPRAQGFTDPLWTTIVAFFIIMIHSF